MRIGSPACAIGRKAQRMAQSGNSTANVYEPGFHKGLMREAAARFRDNLL
jgi:hypothetical protein